MIFFTRKVYCLILTFFIVCQVNATHIVGGVIYYEYLGSGKYKLTFEIYKDCGPDISVGFDGTKTNIQNASLPDFYFSIFEGNIDENIVAYKRNGLKLLDSLRIQPVITNPCLVIDPNTCVVKGRYETIVTLPKNNVGYTIQYMRCCRNSSIINIQNQSGSGDKPGITLRTYIPPYGSTPNNSAIFKNFPPMFICVDQQFYFDHSATDKDGDGLRYYITNPLAGLSSNEPIDSIQTLNVSPINWTSGYGIDNVIGGTPAMTIDSLTGLLSCKPNQVGRFVVSILVKEIRNGVVIDSFARDFQYNVVDCDIPNADLSVISGTYDPKNDIGMYIYCGDFNINFDNKSTHADSYRWNFGDPNSGSNNTSTAVTPSHTFSDTGTFIVTLTALYTKPSGQLCIDSTRRICKIFPKAKVNFEFTEKCVGLPMQFTDKSSTGSGAITSWAWNFGDGGTSTLTNPTHTYSTANKYNVNLKIVNTSGCVSDTVIQVNVFPKPVINAAVPNGCIGQPMDLSCKVSIASPYTISGYRWRLPNGAILNTCNTTYTPTTTASGVINLWAISNKGCEDSANFNFVVNPLPNIVAIRDTTLCYDKNTIITATGGVTYQWTPTTYLANPNTATTVASPPYPTSILYTVKGTDANSCYNTDTLRIKFFVKSFINAGADTSVCLNPSPFKYRDSVRLNGQGSFVSIFWTPTIGLSNPSIRNPLAKPSSTIDYVFNGIDTNNCLIKDTVQVMVLDPNIDLIKMVDTFVCQGDSFMIIPVDQGAISTYSWVPKYWISNPNIRTPYLRPFDTTLYILTISNYCYVKSDSVLINANELPDPGLVALDSICLGDTYQFQSKMGYNTYTWKTSEPTFSNKNIPNPTAKPDFTQKYYLTVVDKYTCKNTDSIILNVNYPPTLSVQGIPRYLCLGDSVRLTALASQFCTFLWRDKTYLSSDTAKTVYAFPQDTTLYYLTATSIQKCSTTVKFTINVQKKIQPYAKRPVSVCKGKFIDLYAEGGLYYLWRPPYNINDTLSRTPQVFPESTFTYKVFISNDCFVDSLPVDVYVDTLPIVNLGKDTSIYRGQEIVLNAITNAETIEWFPKEMINTNPYSYQVNISPKDTTIYYVEVTNNRGCIGRDSVNVFVFGKNVLLIPTGFSPNKDGINDVFRVGKYLNISKLNSFEVYNRWGEKIFTTNDINKGWDGTYDGVACPVGVYVWEIEAVTFDNEKIVRSGNVTLIR